MPSQGSVLLPHVSSKWPSSTGRRLRCDAVMALAKRQQAAMTLRLSAYLHLKWNNYILGLSSHCPTSLQKKKRKISM